jgi:hypothetical protein
MGESTSNEGSATTDCNALPNRDPPDVTRFKAAAAKRVQAHRRRRRLGVRCLTVRVSDRTVRHLISTGYLALESREAAAYVAFALEAWIIFHRRRARATIAFLIPRRLAICIAQALSHDHFFVRNMLWAAS